jgi:hypothetical protein
MVDLDALSASQFERLAGDLLARLGFAADRTTGGDPGVDLTATFRDSDGFAVDTPYLVQLKQGRSSYRDVARLVALVREAGNLCRGLVITNRHLTSLNLNQIARAQQDHVEVQVIDGPRLRSLLLRYPDLIGAHFARGRIR